MNLDEEKKFISSDHEFLVRSSFTNYSAEKTSIFSLPSRIIGAFKSRWVYYFAERKVRNKFPRVALSQDKARLDGGLTGAYQWVRLEEIARIVEEYNIRSVCEFGSGGSTSMFTELNLELFISLDQSKKWAEKTKGSLPQGSCVELLRRDRLVVDFGGEPCTRYDLPEKFYMQNFDMVYIDGPTAIAMTDEEKEMNIVDESLKTMPNIDVELFFENNIYPKLILVDARRATVRRLCENYSDKYHVLMRYNYKSKSDLAGRFLYHTVFVRKDK